ncbi:hypothetical protein EVAR_92502_1 [Eumeta japonica]|uniref:Uncharacterized protein n=1 Tax=Eumeta variegata TaxID=151549 RepID=A0A4C1T8T8_EUMVA|nr:hypothetical protein EVAR_92502_1 [Eumeta japonica]
MDSSGTSSSASHTATSSHAITPSPNATVGFETMTEFLPREAASCKIEQTTEAAAGAIARDPDTEAAARACALDSREAAAVTDDGLFCNISESGHSLWSTVTDDVSPSKCGYRDLAGIEILVTARGMLRSPDHFGDYDDYQLLRCMMRVRVTLTFLSLPT